MKEYNAPFFSLYENLYYVLREECNEARALSLFRTIMERGLRTAYDNYGFIKGNPESFVNVLETRDNAVGLIVKFPQISNDKIVYQFHTDPFPNLKGIVDHTLLDDTYISFKIHYLLGDDWHYKTTRHFWWGDPHTEFAIAKT